jgi:sporulation protein YlmC with PRC-barrel domain
MILIYQKNELLIDFVSCKKINDIIVLKDFSKGGSLKRI